MNENYSRYVEGRAEKSPLFRDCLRSFLVGGAICAFAQGLKLWYGTFGMSEPDTGTLVSCTLIFLTALLTGIGVFDRIAKFAGSGTVVPITGFANSVAAPAIEYRAQGWVFGVGCKIFSIAGPVILYGIFSSWVLGLVYWIGKVLGI